jgi:predicted PurR-regulated permease PerM
LAVAAEIWIFFFNGWLLMFVGAFIAPVLVIVTKSTFAIHLFKKIEAEGGSVSERADISEPDEKSESENEDIPDD